MGAGVSLLIVYILFRPFGLIAPKSLKYLAFQSFDWERTWYRLFKKRVVRTKFDIYVFITITGSIPLLGGVAPKTVNY
jgi:hypothetical protein